MSLVSRTGIGKETWSACPPSRALQWWNWGGRMTLMILLVFHYTHHQNIAHGKSAAMCSRTLDSCGIWVYFRNISALWILHFSGRIPVGGHDAPSHPYKGCVLGIKWMGLCKRLISKRPLGTGLLIEACIFLPCLSSGLRKWSWNVMIASNEMVCNPEHCPYEILPWLQCLLLPCEPVWFMSLL